MQQIVTDLAEVVEHLAYSHNFRSEDVQKRVGELLSAVRDGIARLEDEAPPAPEPASTPAPEAANSPPAVPESPEVAGQMTAGASQTGQPS
jgi:hypothetical protein